MKHRIILISLCLVSTLSFNVLASDIDDNEYSYVNEQEITISFDYGDRTGIYSGGIKNGLPHGIGKFSSTNATGQDWEYIGEWENGHFNGVGTTIYSNGQVSISTYDNDHMYGNGIIVYPDPALYIGEVNDNGGSGDGTSLSISNSYVGEFENGLRNGTGILYFENGNRYEGEFVDQYINGSGIYYLPSGERIEGTFLEDSETALVNGSGTYYSTDNTSYSCTITDGQLSIEGLPSQFEVSIETDEASSETQSEEFFETELTTENISENETEIITETETENMAGTNDFSSEYVENIYFWTTNSGYQYVAYEVNNPTDHPIYFKMETVFLDDLDAAIGTAEDYVRCIGPKEKALLASFNEIPAESINYTRRVEPRYNLVSAQQYMDYSVAGNGNKMVFTVNNTCDKTIQYANIVVLFFSDSQVVSMYDSYLDGGFPGEIRVGSTAYEEVWAPNVYDTYKVYLTGYIE